MLNDRMPTNTAIWSKIKLALGGSQQVLLILNSDLNKTLQAQNPVLS